MTAYSSTYRGQERDSEYEADYSYDQQRYGSSGGVGVYSAPYDADAVDPYYGVPAHEREEAMMDHILELEREVLHLRAVVKQMEEEQVPQIDDLRNRMDVVMQVLWNTGAVG